MEGNGNRAYQYYRQVLPARRNKEADLLEVEPYVLPEYLGKEHPSSNRQKPGCRVLLPGIWLHPASTSWGLGQDMKAWKLIHVSLRIGMASVQEESSAERCITLRLETQTEYARGSKKSLLTIWNATRYH